MHVDARSSADDGSPSEIDHGRPYRNIFPSYSHQDGWVVEEVEGLVESLGDRYLRDATALRTGEV